MSSWDKDGEALMIELTKATQGNFSVEELIELFYFITLPEEKDEPTLTLLKRED
jgi:hypothetical protein|tara:strand:- start:539 stop:700 length:162 start_codon:yes stop_codon:yes gene_type:complete